MWLTIGRFSSNAFHSDQTANSLRVVDELPTKHAFEKVFRCIDGGSGNLDVVDVMVMVHRLFRVKATLEMALHALSI